MAYTLTGLARYQEEIKKSRFLALAGPIVSVADAHAFFQAHAMPEANHNCWAYKLGNDYRFNDDGEPGGTAGRPILQAIEGQQCDRVAVLVIRWFGGIKLGTGGLVRAYSAAAAQCLRLAEKVELIEQVSVACSCSFNDMSRVQSKLPAFQAVIEQENFDEHGVHWVLSLPRVEQAALATAFTDLTRGQGRWKVIDASE